MSLPNTRAFKGHTKAVSLWLLSIGALVAGHANAQHARTVMLDADVSASVALVRVMARGHVQQALSGVQPGSAAAVPGTLAVLPTLAGQPGAPAIQPVIRQSALRQLVVVPGNIQGCQAEMNIGTLQSNRPVLGDVNLQVVVTGNITQLVGGNCP